MLIAALALLTAASAQDLTLGGDCPGVARIEATGITPGASVMIVTGDRAGSTAVPVGECAGVDIGLAGAIRPYGPLRDADRDGVVRVAPTLPGPACGLSFVALDLTSCSRSEVATFDGGGGGSCAFSAPSTPMVDSIVETGGDGSTPMTLAWDGSRYYFASGGSPASDLQVYESDGRLTGSYDIGLDQRSVFTRGDGVGPTYVRPYNSSTIYVEAGLGSYVDSGVRLVGGTLDDQSAVVWDATRDHFVGRMDDTLTRWDASGALVGETTLLGAAGAELEYPAERNVAVANNSCTLTYAEGVVSSWDEAGNRVDQVTLDGGGVDFNSDFSFSFADGMVWVFDDTSGAIEAFVLPFAD